MAKWIRTACCGLCGRDRCTIDPDNPRRGYCYRFGRHYFLGPDGGVNYLGKTDRKKKPVLPDNNQTFDFGGEDQSTHLDAISL